MTNETFHIACMHVLYESISSWFVGFFISNQTNLKLLGVREKSKDIDTNILL
ncbi:hypothetical protein Hanom_Chr14g01298801 [Helianthus anomalus]